MTPAPNGPRCPRCGMVLLAPEEITQHTCERGPDFTSATVSRETPHGAVETFFFATEGPLMLPAEEDDQC